MSKILSIFCVVQL